METNPLSITLFTNIFSRFVGCLFILFIVSFAMQKLLSLIGTHLFIFVFISITLGGGIIEDLAVIYVRECSACVFLKSFIVSDLTIRFLIHFEFIFMYGVRRCSNFILLHAIAQSSQHHLLKGLHLESSQEKVPFHILVFIYFIAY